MVGALQSQPLANLRRKGDCPPLRNGYCSHAAILQYSRSFVKFPEGPDLPLAKLILQAPSLLLHGGCRIVVAVDVVAEDPVVIDEGSLDDLRTRDHYGLLDIDRLLNDYGCGCNIGGTGNG